MATLAAEMVRKSLQSFIEADAELARAVLTMDDAVDAMNRAAYKSLTKVMEEQSHIRSAGSECADDLPRAGAGGGSRNQHRRGRDLLGEGRGCAPPQERDGSTEEGCRS